MFQYRPHFIPSAIYVVGCGGTGSRLVPMLSQLVKTTMRQYNPLGWIESLPIFLIDDDVVETKNLMRQNFIAQDVSQFKSVVLASRYNRGFEVPIYPCTARVTKEAQNLTFEGFPNLTAPPKQNIILIMAVDSAEARRQVLNHFNYGYKNKFIIDAGNEDTFGQVKFFTDTALVTTSYEESLRGDRTPYFKSLPKMIPTPYSVDYIPYPNLYYTNLGSSVSEKSCADLDQTLAINSMMATLMCGVLQNFLYIKPMNFHEIRYDLNGAVSTTYNTAENWFKDISTEHQTYHLRSRIPLKYTFSHTGYNEPQVLYRNSVVASLNAMGLNVDPKTGEIIQAKKVEEAAAVAPKAKKPAKKKIQHLDEDEPDDLDEFIEAHEVQIEPL